jgi:SAM-dependent methyltransferase
MVPVSILDPKPGERILDLCAAPGNKTAQMALALGNGGTVVANDMVFSRLKALRATIDRLGLVNVTVTCADGSNYPRSAGLFDAVLVDVPCSCEGTSRKTPGVLDAPSSLLRRQIQRQEPLLEQAIRRCRPGGRVLYSTCTYAPEENEMVVASVIDRWPDRVRILPARLPGFKVAEGLTRWNGRSFHPDLRHTLRIWPHLNDTGGFYVALLQRTGDETPAAASPVVRDPGFSRNDYELPVAPPGMAPTLERLTDRFGIPRRRFDGLYFFTKRKGTVMAVAGDHRPPLRMDRAMGLPLVHVKGPHEKLTTAGAMLLGAVARRNAVDLDGDQMRAYLMRGKFSLSAAQAAQCSEDGYILVRYQGAPLGVGVFRSSDARVASLFPKRRALF